MNIHLSKFLANKLFFIPVFTFVLAGTLSAKSLDTSISSTKAKQGEIFELKISNCSKKPKVWFNLTEFHAYKIADKKYRALLPIENLTKPGSYDIMIKAGKKIDKVVVEVEDNKKEIQKITLDSSKSGLRATSKELSSVKKAMRQTNENKYWQGKFIYPSTAAKSSPFGVKRSYNGAPVSSYHKGLDFAGSHGSAVLAPANAKVSDVGYESEGFNVHGNTIMLDHGHGVDSIYLHLSKILVNKGDTVVKGQKIAEVGHTGISTGPHLHWGVYVGGISVEPEYFVKHDVE